MFISSVLLYIDFIFSIFAPSDELTWIMCWRNSFVILFFNLWWF